MKPTKTHIADKALRLFNEKGFVNVRLQHIADAAFVSVGHLAYHFKTKDTIVAFLYDDFVKKQELLMSQYRVVPLFEDINSYFTAIYHLQTAFIFIYTDALEIIRAYPFIQAKYIQYSKWQLTQLILMLEFNTSRGALAVTLPISINNISESLFIQISTWRYAVKSSNIQDENLPAFLASLWHFIMPWFTDTGKLEYRQMNLNE